ncbi:uncharacterized protein LOC121871968 [Homarus americanus]|uniref:uncharacterized protein LOC121871968 n=1 Tax=Homarus americanus TaxID=6706 RepID=UPI001C4898D4|nr:uncharacterized protein LOC121871968 [Homarus americanus]
MAGNLTDIEFFILTPDDFQETLRFFDEQFLKRNPLCIASKETCKEAFGEHLNVALKEALESGFSMGARDKTTKALVGIRLTKITSVDNVSKQTASDEAKLTENNLYRVLAMLSPDEDVFRGVSSFLYMFALAVHRDYCGHGLASRLVKVISL